MFNKKEKLRKERIMSLNAIPEENTQNQKREIKRQEDSKNSLNVTETMKFLEPDLDYSNATSFNDVTVGTGKENTPLHKERGIEGQEYLPEDKSFFDKVKEQSFTEENGIKTEKESVTDENEEIKNLSDTQRAYFKTLIFVFLVVSSFFLYLTLK